MYSFKYLKILAACTIVAAFAVPAHAQSFDPRQPLAAMLSAFRNCGPPQTYQMLSPQLFNIVGQQTGGRGCYAEIAAAGPIASMDILGQQMFPVGPLFLIRVTHASGIKADWFIGFNQYSGKIEYLTFQPAFGNIPTIDTGPNPSTKKGPSPAPSPTPPTDTGDDDGCRLYPTMCN